MWASAPTKSPAAYAPYARADRVVRLYVHLPYLHLIPALSFRGAKRRGNPHPRARRRGTPSRRIVQKDIPRLRARGTFAHGGKSTQKRRSNLRFENPLRAFAQHLSRWCSPRERCAMQISPKCCIVSAPLSAAAFALKCKAAQFYVSTRKHFQKQRPKAATYLCRFVAKARFDNRHPQGGCFQRGRAAALPLWSLKDGGFSRGKEDRNFLPP